jgi:hypothetical protein
MAIELKKPFSHYVAVDELPKTGDARKFVVNFPYQIEGTAKTGRRFVEWSYTGTQEAIDQNSGLDGLARRQQRAIEQLERSIAKEVAASGDRIYDSPDQKIPLWGTKR